MLTLILLLAAADRAAFLDAHCAACHNADQKKGGLDLAALKADLGDREAVATWVRLHDRVARGEMPPAKKSAPPPRDKAAFLAALAADLTRADAARKGTVLRRLNRLEYTNTLNDLFGTRADLAELLPEDGKAHGFDTVGEALDLSGVQLQRYMDAADRALTAATRLTPKPESVARSYSFATGRNAENIGKHWLKRDDGAVVFFNTGGFPSITPFEFRASADGRYKLHLTGYAHQSPEPITFAVYAGSFGRFTDSRLLGYFAFGPGAAQTADLDAYLERTQTIRLFPQGIGGPGIAKLGPDKYPGPGLAIHSIHVEGPIYDEWPGRGHKLLFADLPLEQKRFAPKGRMEVVSRSPSADAERLLKAFVPAAFRRPVGDAKVAPYLKLAKEQLAEGAPFEQAMRTAYTAVLCSPDFLYLVEPAGTLDDHALAARLSYFLWRSAPDAALLALAARGELSRPAVLRAQTERLLADARAERFVGDFVGQWLNLREIDFTTPDAKLYPEFDEALKHAMLAETEQVFAAVLKSDLPIADFLDSDWTIVNERLARHYGIDGVKGPAMRRVALRPEHHRGGLLTHGSVLKVSANGTTSSPVVRGAWVLERLLGEPPPPPPPGIPGVEPDIRGAVTLRQQLDKHRTLTSCNGCHKVIDPPGFALENYDPIGGWRERYRIVGFPKRPADTLRIAGPTREFRVALGPAVDTAGDLPDGRAFRGPAEYKKLLMSDPDRFARALVEKLAVFATGRGLGFSDRPAVRAVADGKRGLRELVHALVQNPLFRTK